MATKKIATIAFHWSKDSAIAIGIGGRVQCVLELERYFNVRYFAPNALSADYYRADWLKALHAVRNHCECDDGSCPSRFDEGVIVDGSLGADVVHAQLPLIVEEVFIVDRWRNVNHHEAHALLGFYASRFRSALAISYDGGGDDGNFNVFMGKGMELRHVAREYYNLGEAYSFLAILMPEVTGISGEDICHFLDPGEDNETWVNGLIRRPQSDRESDAGKLMGYAATGEVVPEISGWVRSLLERKAAQSMFEIPPQLIRVACGSVQGQRSVAASVQAVFEQMVLSKIALLLNHVITTNAVEGIVITGGCALNVLVNQAVRDTLTMASNNLSVVTGRDLPLDVYVPPAPNDGGLVVGALWAVDPPLVPQPLQYVGFRLWDMDTLPREAYRRGAQSLIALGGVEYLARLLAGGAAWQKEVHSNGKSKPIIAVVRGRQEFGPRALGHRSLLAVPDDIGMRERMNRLKFRRWFRPVAPMIADEGLRRVFGHEQKSRYMEMAPRVQDEVLKQFPALAHLDGTARHQSVGKNDEPWLHALLIAVGEKIGLPALINTSFNTKGAPMVNTVRHCLDMLDTLPDLDYVLIDDWLFRPPLGRPLEAPIAADTPRRLGVIADGA